MSKAMAYYDIIVPATAVGSHENADYPSIFGVDCSPASKVKSSQTGTYTYTLTLTTAQDIARIVVLNVGTSCADKCVITAKTYNSSNNLIETLQKMTDTNNLKGGYYIEIVTGAPVYNTYRNLVFTPVSATDIKKVVIDFALNGQSEVFTAELGKAILYSSAYEFSTNFDADGTAMGHKINSEANEMDKGTIAHSFLYRRFSIDSKVSAVGATQIDILTGRLPIFPICFMPLGEDNAIYYGFFECEIPTMSNETTFNLAFKFTELI